MINIIYLFNLFNLLQNRDKMLGHPRMYRFSPTHSINSMKHDTHVRSPISATRGALM